MKTYIILFLLKIIKNEDVKCIENNQNIRFGGQNDFDYTYKIYFKK